MSDWKPKRFWTTVSVRTDGPHHLVHLDDKVLKTPGKVPLRLPTRGLADWIAAEWQAQEGLVDPNVMPATRMANSALEKVAPQRAEVATIVAAYGETDLLCYRAERPEALVARQAQHWDPLLEWAGHSLGARLRVGPGVMPIAQDPAVLKRLASEVAGMDVFTLTAFHDLVSLSGSLIVGLAVAKGVYSANEGWDLSRIDETWQSEQWGFDEEAVEHAARKRAAFMDAERFYRLSIGQAA